MSQSTRWQTTWPSALAAEQGQNWWATASVLQPIGNPWNVVRDVFFERSDFTKLSPPDRELLAQALVPWEDIDND